MIEGQQFRFQLEGIWHSDIPPRPGQAVEVYLDRELQVIGLSAITETEAPQQVSQDRPQAPQPGTAPNRIFGRLYAKFLGRDRQHAKSGTA